MNTTLFPLGRVVMTPGVINLSCSGHLIDDIKAILNCHQSGDWGVMDAEDCHANEQALKYGYRIMSAYDIDNQRIWVITEHDRSSTTLLLPDEY